MAHGSRRSEANQEVQRLAEKIQAQLDRMVLACFLEQAEPSISQGIDLALKNNAKEILALPYFLTEGRHVSEDISKIIQEKARAYPEIPMKVLKYLGAHEQLPDLLTQIILKNS